MSNVLCTIPNLCCECFHFCSSQVRAIWSERCELNIVFLNGPTMASFCILLFFSTTIIQKVHFRVYRTQIVGVEGEHADHLTTITTTALKKYIYLLHKSRKKYSTNWPQRVSIFKLKFVFALTTFQFNLRNRMLQLLQHQNSCLPNG